MQPETDATAIARSLVDPQAFTAVFDRHWAAIYAFCTSRAGDGGEDIAAEAFRVAFDQRHRFDGRGDDAAPWLYGIATNLLRRYFRTAERGRRAARRAVETGHGDPTDDALNRIEADRLGPTLSAALRTLPAADRDALLLLAWAGLTYEEISEALDIPIGTVRSRIHRARTTVHAHLTREETR
ncbi:MAG TPA: sigma-70 family RNA polymerase sigma factor [Gaiellaceae bacterium]|nr:sigma-70 family RNA polymerase sigma factor [Gaiellaceae bacterium]